MEYCNNIFSQKDIEKSISLINSVYLYDESGEEIASTNLIWYFNAKKYWSGYERYHLETPGCQSCQNSIFIGSKNEH